MLEVSAGDVPQFQWFRKFLKLLIQVWHQVYGRFLRLTDSLQEPQSFSESWRKKAFKWFLVINSLYHLFHVSCSEVQQ